jgi:hypothetical protein
VLSIEAGGFGSRKFVTTSHTSNAVALVTPIRWMLIEVSWALEAIAGQPSFAFASRCL